MLVPTMTPEEIYAEMRKDALWLQNKMNDKLIPEARKKVKRAKRYPYITRYVLKSENTNIEYRAVFFAYQHRDWENPRCILYTKYAHESGKTLVYLEQNRFAIRLYTHHFLHRYRERLSERAEELSALANLDFELYFIIQNWDVEEMRTINYMINADPDSELAKILKSQKEKSRFWQDPDYERYSAACLSGVCLCERHKSNPNISIYDTFINISMLKLTQLVDFIPAYSRVFLEKICYCYPRQRKIIANEWNEFVDNVPHDENSLDAMIDKICELTTRYPLSAVL